MNRRRHTIRIPVLAITAAAAILVGLVPSAAAAPAQVDTTFGVRGVARIAAGSNHVWMMSTGSGTIVVTNGRVVRRLDGDGRPDLAFGDGGRTVLPAGYSFLEGAAGPGGRLLFVGTDTREDSFQSAVVALDATGRLDGAFGDGGVFRPGLRILPAGAAVDALGRLVFTGGGSASSTGELLRGNTVVVRVTTAGALDPGFDGDGVAWLDRSEGEDDGAHDVAVDAAGRIVLALWSDRESEQDQLLLRLDSTGAVDSSFGTAGMVRLGAGVERGSTHAVRVIVDPGGRLLVVGGRSDGRLTIRAFGAEGGVDPTWGDGGLATSVNVDPFGGQPWFDEVFAARDASGRIVVGTSANTDLAIARFTPTGGRDRTWSSSGLAYFDVGVGLDDDELLGGVLVDEQQRVVLAAVGRQVVGSAKKPVAIAVRLVGGTSSPRAPRIFAKTTCHPRAGCGARPVLRVRLGMVPVGVPVTIRAWAWSMSPGFDDPLPVAPLIDEDHAVERKVIASAETPARVIGGLFPRPGRYVVEVRVPATATTMAASSRLVIRVPVRRAAH